MVVSLEFIKSQFTFFQSLILKAKDHVYFSTTPGFQLLHLPSEPKRKGMGYVLEIGSR